MSQRLVESLALRQGDRPGIAPFILAGDGGLETTLAVMLAAAGAGAACVELGVPFSDPIADGPVLQAAASRALRGGTDMDGILEIIARFRAASDVPLVLMSYANPICRRGWARMCGELADAGGDGLIVPDAPLEEGEGWSAAARAAGLAPVFLVAPSTLDSRIVAASEWGRGFLYVVGRSGVTGAQTPIGREAKATLRRARSQSRLPLALGFGLATSAQVDALTGFADLAIVGTALVKEIRRAGGGQGASAEAAARYIRRLVGGSNED